MKTSCKQFLLSGLAAASMLLGGSPATQAAPITIRFTAVVTHGNLYLPPGIGVGNVITGFYTYESTTPDAAPDSPRHGLDLNAITALDMTIAGIPRTLAPLEPGNRIHIGEGGGGRRRGSDSYNLNAPLNGGYTFWMNLEYPNGDAWDSDALPLTAPRIPEKYSLAVYLTEASEFAAYAELVSLELVTDTTPPVLSLPANLLVEATGPDGAVANYTASATDDTDGAVPVTLNPASGSTFPLGTTTVNASASDAAGNTASGSFTVTVQDTTAPVITSLNVSSAVLWPANHKMVSVSVGGTATDAVSAVTGRILSVTSNEPDNGLGDGDTAGDIVITGPGTVSLRAERSGKGNGRIYTILFEASDAAGNASTKTVTVIVPKSQGK